MVKHIIFGRKKAMEPAVHFDPETQYAVNRPRD